MIAEGGIEGDDDKAGDKVILLTLNYNYSVFIAKQR